MWSRSFCIGNGGLYLFKQILIIIYFYLIKENNERTSLIDAIQIQNNLGFRIWHLNLGFST
jgi:hypothetical protein